MSKKHRCLKLGFLQPYPALRIIWLKEFILAMRKNWRLIFHSSVVSFTVSPLFSEFGETILNVNLAARYYYNQRKRMWEGYSANNLSANYFSLKGTGAFASRFDFNPIYPQIEALYGIQRRLGSICFVDLNFGASLYFPRGPEPIVNLVLGFGL